MKHPGTSAMQTCPTCKAEIPPFLLACPTCSPEKLEPAAAPAAPVPERVAPPSAGILAPAPAPPTAADTGGFPWKILIGVGIALAGIVLIIVVVVLNSRSEIHIVNTSNQETITVLLDDQVVAKELPRATIEAKDRTVRVRVSSGQHHLVAQDAAGNTIDEIWADVDARHNLYAPAHAKDTCFTIEKSSSTFDFETSKYRKDDELPREKSFWALPDGINLFFEPVAGTGKNKLWALRQQPCPLEQPPPDVAPAATPRSTAPWPLYTPPRPTPTHRPPPPRRK